MGEKLQFQPLTLYDKISVVIYRTGIVISALLLLLGGFFLFWHGMISSEHLSVFIVLLYVSVGLSVATIHIYVKRFRRFIRGLYLLSLVFLSFLIFEEGMSFGRVLLSEPSKMLYLLPLSGCLAFITMKEAFCFRLNEGYLLTFIFPLMVLLLAIKGISYKLIAPVVIGTGIIFCYFTIRKITMPLYYDIGDKSAYE